MISITRMKVVSFVNERMHRHLVLCEANCKAVKMC